jgi:NADH:ubiquinone oxidoreductase subunit D
MDLYVIRRNYTGFKSLLAITCFAMDTGALTPFLFAFEQREKLMEFYERVCGA